MRHTGRSDVALEPEGREQARAVGRRLGDHTFGAVLVSPLERARETAVLAGFPEAEICQDLREWDYGAYEGRTTAEIRDQRPGWDLFDDGAPGGEALADVTARVDRVIARVRAVPGNVACVAHAHLLRIMAARWVGLDGSGGRYFVLGAASVSELGWEREQPVIVTWNRC